MINMISKHPDASIAQVPVSQINDNWGQLPQFQKSLQKQKKQ